MHVLLKRFILSFFAITLLSACGNSSRDGSQTGNEREQVTGQFIDAAVWGLGYAAEDLQGTTDVDGKFNYRSGGLIRFSLAGVELGDRAVTALPIMTPRDVFSPKADLDDRRVINLARLLLSLDIQPDNPLVIDVRQAVAALQADSLSAISLDVAFDQLLASNPKIANYLQANNKPLVSAEQAQQHLQCSEEDIAAERTADGRCDGELPLLFAQDISQPEGNEQRVLSFAVQLSSPSEQQVSVNFATANGTALAGEDYAATNGTLVFEPGQTTQTIAITILGDATVEPDETFFVDFTNSVNAELSSARYSITLLNDDLAPGQVQLTLTPQSIEEGTSTTNTVMQYRIGRSGGLDRNVDIRVSTSNQTAQAGSDYIALNNVLFTIPAQQTTFDIPIEIIADNVTEPDETFELTVTAVSESVTVIGSPAMITIRDDDMPGGPLILTLDPIEPVLEGNAEKVISLTARLSRESDQPVSLIYSTRDGSATSQGTKRDFEAVNQREVIIPAGELTSALAVRIFGDNFEEFNEQFDVLVTSSLLSEPLTQTVTLLNDEALTLLQVGAASQSVTPTKVHIAGMTESYFGGTRLQRFHLGGFGFGPFKLLPGYGPAPELTVGDAPISISEAPAGAPCFSDAVINSTENDEHGHDCHDETWVRVMVMVDPVKGERIAWVTLDAIGAGNLIQDAVKKAVNEASCAQDLCIPIRNVLFGQTHTHAGADLQGLWGGVPKDWQQKMLFDGVKAATTKSLAQRKPAQLSLVRGDASAFNNYRRPKYRDESIFHQADPAASLLMAQADDEANDHRMLATLAQFSAHPTSVGANDFRREDGTVVRVPHPDYPLGVVERLEQQLGGTSLYFNGAIADASPSGPATGSNKYEQVKSRGENLANLLLGLRGNAVPVGASLSVAHAEVVVPVTNPLFIGVGLLSQFNGYYQFSQLPKDDIPGFNMIPASLIESFEELQNQLPQPAPIARTLVSRISIGQSGDDAARVEMVTIPGEATNTFGQYIRRLSGDSPLSDAKPNVHTMLLGLTHNSFGYIIPEDEFSYIDPTGDVVGYEEIVSLGPLTAPLLRLQGYNPLFGIQPPDIRFLPPLLTDCTIAFDFGACFIGVGRDRLLQFLSVPTSFFDTLSDGAKSVADGCRDVAGPLAPACAVFDAVVTVFDTIPNPSEPGTPGGGTPSIGTDDAALLSEVVLASSPAGCDFLDPAHCLLPFPNNHFTKTADTDTGRQLQLNLLAMPRNVLGKPIDPSDQNRADGFSPGQTILLRVPGLDLDKTAEAAPVPRLGRPGAGQSAESVPQSMANSLHPDSAIVVFDVTDKKPHLVWAEMDANLTRYTPCDFPAPIQTLSELGGQDEINNAVQTFRDGCNQLAKPLQSVVDLVDPTSDPGPLLIIRPGVNFEPGRRYIVALRHLHNSNGEPIEAGAGFRLCRDNLTSPLRSLPAVDKRCAAVEEILDTLEMDAGIDPDELYVAWDFTVASERSLSTRLLGIRDQTLKDKATPSFSIASVVNNECEPGVTDCVARVIKGTMSIPNFISRPLLSTGQSDLDRQVTGRFWFGKLRPGPYDVPQPFPLQPKLNVPFTCHVPNTALKANGDVAPSRVSLYGHGLFGSQGEIGQGQLRRFGNEHNFTFCAADWIGMAGVADVVNAVTVLLDMSNFPTLADRVQQGILNFVVMGRLLKADDGFISHPAFQAADGRPLIDNRHVFFDGNSQGGIDGGVVVAISPDVHRGVLGVPGMNYSTLLQRSVDFDGYARLFYPAYPNTIDQQLTLGLVQMLWDRAENNGYAHNLGDGVAGQVTVAGKTHVIGSPNSTLPGLDGQPLPKKDVLLHVGFGDHQVSMTSAEVMARTIGAQGADTYFRRPADCAGDVTHCFANRDGFMERHPDVDPYLGLDLLTPDSLGYGAGQGSYLVVFDEGKTATPPADNRPPKADPFDPHEYPRNLVMARCQKARFLRDDGALIYTDLLTNPINCPQQRGDGVVFAGDAAVLPPGQGGGPVDPPAQAQPDYGSGVFGVVATFVAQLNEAFMALIEGDFGGAFAFGQQAFTGLGGNLISLLTIGDDSLVAAGSDAFAAAPDPQSMFTRFLAGLGRFIGLQSDPLSTLQALGSADRNSEAVVISGAQLLGWAGPAAIGSGFPYPSGAATTGDPFPAPLGNIRSAHNGVAFDPAFGQGPNVPVEQVAAYAFRDGEFVEIPVQVDERMPFFLANGNSSFSTYSGTDTEINYVWDIERWDLEGECFQNIEGKGAKPDPAVGLDMDDEVVFMAQDAGELVPNPLDVLAWADGRKVQQVLVVDPLSPGIPKAVYLVVQAQGSKFRDVKDHYVRYQRDENADQWIDRTFFREDDPEKLGTSNTGYGSNLKGTVCTDGTPATAKQSNDRFPRDGLVVETDTYRFEASGRWMKRDLRIRRPGDDATDSSYWESRPDLIDRWKGRAFQQSPDSVISLVGFEDEQVNWEANSIIIGERCGPVRCMREVWGADSGTNVTKTETFYRDAVAYRYRVRVHPIPPDGLYTSWDYNRSAMVPAPGEQVPGGRYYTALRPQGVPIDGINDDIGQIDGHLPIAGMCIGSDGPVPASNGLCPMFFDAADPTFNLPLAFNNWEQVSAKGNNGSLVYIFALKGATSLVNPLVIPYYRDDACLDDGTGDDPVARPFPGESYQWNNAMVPKTYDLWAGRALDHSGKTFADCLQRQGAHAAHGIHFLVTHDTDNAFTPLTTTEIDGEQWQFMVPTDAPKNVGDRYANIIRVPLISVATPLSLPSLTPPNPPSGLPGLEGLSALIDPSMLQRLLGGIPIPTP
ncbi:MAG: Calx-beta domain-containing protein [Moraxellaceae bacterium]|nr:Calx-beta domain-containing protein [Moraxellaceae bacterium]MDZ4388011.1 Calx-beta domain-containing protein [Moraxellaceae bacterium]